MKIIGKTQSGYVALVDHTELEKVVDKYYGNLKRLEVGDDFNLGAGYDFRAGIQSAAHGMREAHDRFESARKTLMAFAVMASELPAPPEPATAEG